MKTKIDKENDKMAGKIMVLGFLFSKKATHVALIRKQKPEWQRGYLNGIGGKVEECETPRNAMIREFEEETGMRFSGWKHCITFTCDGGTVKVYKGYLPLRELDCIDCHESEGGEIVELCYVSNIESNFLNAKPLDNLRWMIPILLDNLEFPITLRYNSRGGCKQEAEFIEGELT